VTAKKVIAMSEHKRSYSRSTQYALRLLGGAVKLARKERKMTERELAMRVGIARSTVQQIEKGDPRVEIGLVFEAASIVGVSLFEADERDLSSRLERVEDKLTLLPRSIRKPRREVRDDF